MTKHIFLSISAFLFIDSAAASTEFIRIDDMMVVKPSTGSISAQGASLLNVELWEDGVLPVAFDRGITAEEKRKFFAACDEWESAANVQCIEGSYKERQVTVTKQTDGCWALWGMGTHFGGFKRRINLSSGCWSHHLLMHEIGHAFGMIHEHQRPDRDDYVTIHKENADAGFLGLDFKINFDKQEAILQTPYDFLSIMHYPRRARSKNRKDTIVPKDPYLQFIDVMGRVKELSEGDKQTMANLYGAPIP